MAAIKYGMAFISVIALLASTGSVAQSTCSNKVMGLSSCVTYITKNSSTPSSSCCASLDRLAKSQPECLCPLLSSGAGFSLGIALNRTLALALPAACNLQTHPVSQCSKLATAPAPSALSPPTDTFSGSPENQGTTITPSAPPGLETLPDFHGIDTSDGSTVPLPIFLKLPALFTAAWITKCSPFSTIR